MRRRLSLVAAAAIALVLAACDPLQPPAGPAPLRYRDDVFTTVTKTTDITYGSAVDQNNVRVTLKFDLYEPAGDTVKQRPAIIWVHGGGFSGGDKTSPELVDEANNFARKGYVNISINYRLAPQGCVGNPGPSCLIGIQQAQYDAQTAVRYLRSKAKKYHVDPTRIAIGGSSAGAITALNVGYSGEQPGPGDHQGVSSSVEAVQSLSGAAIGSATIGAGDAPALLFHGTDDPLVPYAWAQATVKAATAAHLVIVLRTFDGDGHVPYLQHRDQILEETRNFFYNELGLGALNA